MRLKHICFLNPLTCRKSMDIVCVYCITTDHIFKPDKFDEASLNSTNSELRRTTARVSEQNIVQVWLVRSCEICAILCPWTSLDCSVCLWCLQMASFLIHFIAFGVLKFSIAWQFIYLSRTNLLTILILFWCFTDALPLAGQACGTGKGGRNWDPWSFWLPQGVYPKTAGRAGSKQTREWQSPEFFLVSLHELHIATFRYISLFRPSQLSLPSLARNMMRGLLVLSCDCRAWYLSCTKHSLSSQDLTATKSFPSKHSRNLKENPWAVVAALGIRCMYPLYITLDYQ